MVKQLWTLDMSERVEDRVFEVVVLQAQRHSLVIRWDGGEGPWMGSVEGVHGGGPCRSCFLRVGGGPYSRSCFLRWIQRLTATHLIS